MKKRSKLTLHRETIALLEARHLKAAGGDCTCSCCYTDCCPPPSNEFSCLNSCTCTTQNGEFSCICA